MQGKGKGPQGQGTCSGKEKVPGHLLSCFDFLRIQNPQKRVVWIVRHRHNHPSILSHSRISLIKMDGIIYKMEQFITMTERDIT